MKFVWCLVGVLLTVVVLCHGSNDEIEKRVGGKYLTKTALKQLAQRLRHSSSLERTALDLLEKWSGHRIQSYKVIEVIDGVANRLDAYTTATCGFFSDVGVTVGIPRNIGYQICNVALDLL